MNEKVLDTSRKQINMPQLIIFLFMVIGGGFLLIGKDMQALLRWDIALMSLGMAALPITGKLFGNISERTYLFGRILGLCFSSYIMWTLSFLKIFKFSGRNSIIVALALGIICYGIYLVLFNMKKDKKTDFSTDRCAEAVADTDCTEGNCNSGRCIFEGKPFLEHIIFYETVFLLIFILCTWYLGHRIPSNETERLMDFAFMKSLDRCNYMPPLDVWASGEYINYYYYGQYMMTFLSKLSFVDIKEGYSLALSFIMCTCLVYTYIISKGLMERTGHVSKSISSLAGICSAFGVGLFGNVHYVIFYKIVPIVWDVLRISGERPSYWFAESTRYIGYIPNNEADRTISEFPFYSFLIGDLHAHVIGIPIVLTIIAVTIAYCFKLTNGKKVKKINLNLIIIGILIAISSMTNYWDYIIYFTLVTIVLFVINFLVYGKTKDFIISTILQIVFVLLLSRLVNILFMSRFDKMFDGVGIVKAGSYLHQLAILWGLPIACVILFVIYLLNKRKYGTESIDLSDILIAVLGICGMGLCIIPELVFVKDIYIDGFPRANTMFKLTYQAFILFGISMGYIFAALINTKIEEESSKREYFTYCSVKKVTVVLFCLWLMTGGYFITAGRMWMGDISTWEYKGIDSTKTIVEQMGSEIDTVEFIDNEIKNSDIILVADGSSYTENCVIPALTGHPTVLGWYTHEWLWHNSHDYVEERKKDILEIYTGNDVELKKKLIEKYSIAYIYVGDKEKSIYSEINTSGIESIGTPIYFDDEGRILYAMNSMQ